MVNKIKDEYKMCYYCNNFELKHSVPGAYCYCNFCGKIKTNGYCDRYVPNEYVLDMRDNSELKEKYNYIEKDGY